VFGLQQSHLAKLKRDAGKNEPAMTAEELGLELNGQEERRELEAFSNDSW
jgi:hypothetical protein